MNESLSHETLKSVQGGNKFQASSLSGSKANLRMKLNRSLKQIGQDSRRRPELMNRVRSSMNQIGVDSLPRTW